MREEIWMDIKNYEDKYAISDQGRVYSYLSKKYLAQQVNKDGYLFVKLSFDGKKKTEYIHRLVARHFLDNPTGLPQVNHKDENPQNNWVENLEWCDSKYNNNYGEHNNRVAKAHCKPVLCVETGEVFNSAKQVEEKIGIFATQVSAVCRGKGKTAKGYHWKYI